MELNNFFLVFIFKKIYFYTIFPLFFITGLPLYLKKYGKTLNLRNFEENLEKSKILKKFTFSVVKFQLDTKNLLYR